MEPKLQLVALNLEPHSKINFERMFEEHLNIIIKLMAYIDSYNIFGDGKVRISRH